MISDSGRKDAPCLVLIHGFPFTRAMWKHQIEAFSSVCRVIAYDVRGHGEAEIGDGQYLIGFFVDDLLEILEERRIAKAILCGVSMGGYIALRFAELHPERLRALILCDTRAEADTNEGKAKRAQSIRIVKRGGLKRFAAEFVKGLFS